jgi:transformation/transcription domain-associated protein
MDTQILIDALAVIMGHEEKELCKPGNLALVLILDTATTILGSKERVSQTVSVQKPSPGPDSVYSHYYTAQ